MLLRIAAFPDMQFRKHGLEIWLLICQGSRGIRSSCVQVLGHHAGVGAHSRGAVQQFCACGYAESACSNSRDGSIRPRDCAI